MKRSEMVNEIVEYLKGVMGPLNYGDWFGEERVSELLEKIEKKGMKPPGWGVNCRCEKEHWYVPNYTWEPENEKK